LANIVDVGDILTKIMYVLIPGRYVNIESEFIIDIMNIKQNYCLSDCILCLLDDFLMHGAGGNEK
jgi:hypothetical protein